MAVGSKTMRSSMTTLEPGLLSVSVVSHGQSGLARLLLDDLQRVVKVPFEVVLTLNISGDEQVDSTAYSFAIRIVRNAEPKGFGANHNAAFGVARGEFFCVINPDVRLTDDPFATLIAASATDGIGVVGPRVVSPAGAIEDSGRVFPSAGRLLRKLWTRGIRRQPAQPDYTIGDVPIEPDWIGGMCMLFRSQQFESIGGFDERYFLYYEDVDLCWRLRRRGWRVLLQPSATVVHGARRSSWTNRRYMRWHLTSMGRFLITRALHPLMPK